jgi:molybdenum cofactor synthesis domain-containing protein
VARKTPDSELNRLLHPDEAKNVILSRVCRLQPEEISLRDAYGRILCDDIISREDFPPFPAATMDGYAVIAEDPSPWREIIGHQTAGYVENFEVHLGSAAWITTGAPVPRGADAVVPVESTEASDGHVVIVDHAVQPGDNIRPVGVDLAAGVTVLEAGSPIGPAEIGLLASLGVDPVRVSRRPRVSVLSTGNELVEPDQLPGPGQIRDSNRFSLNAAAQEAGGEVIWTGHGPDDRRDLERTLRERLQESDVLLTSGGVSMGDLDLVKPLLGELTDVHFRRQFKKPGKPYNFATREKTLVFGLPGNPVSAMVGFEVLVRPAIRLMLGAKTIDRPRVTVRARHSLQSSDRIEYQRAVVKVAPSGFLEVQTTGSQASSRLASFVDANALLIVPANAGVILAGAELDALLIGPVSDANWD